LFTFSSSDVSIGKQVASRGVASKITTCRFASDAQRQSHEASAPPWWNARRIQRGEWSLVQACGWSCVAENL